MFDEIISLLFKFLTFICLTQSLLTFCIFWIKSNSLWKIAFSFSTVTTIKLNHSFQIHGFRSFFMINNSQNFSCFFSLTSFSKTLNFNQQKFFILWNFIYEIRDTWKCFSIIFNFEGLSVLIEVGNVMFDFLDLVWSYLSLLNSISFFESSKSLLKMELLHQSCSFFLYGFDIIRIEMDWSITLLYTLRKIFHIEIT